MEIKDKNNIVLNLGNSVILPIPSPFTGDLHDDKFIGVILCIKEHFITVKDGNGDCFKISPHRVELKSLY